MGRRWNEVYRMLMSVKAPSAVPVIVMMWLFHKNAHCSNNKTIFTTFSTLFVPNSTTNYRNQTK